MASRKKIEFDPKDLRGSRLRCLMLTSGSRRQVAERLNALVAPYAQIDPDRDQWMPRGFLEPAEADLCKIVGLLHEQVRRDLTAWWLANPRGARCPVWDITATATIDGRRGFVVVVAAHFRTTGETRNRGT